MSRTCARVAAPLALAVILAASAQAEIVQRGSLRVAVSGELKPRRLPRTGTAPLFSLARTTFRFAGAKSVSTGLTRRCQVRGGGRAR